MATENKLGALLPPKAPNLPLATLTYDSRQQEQFSNALRLYFNQIDNFCQSFSSGTGGAFLQFPNGAFHQDGNTTLTAGIANNSTTPIPVASTSLFASSGSILIGSELINYTGKTPTTFTGITRGVYGTTNVAHSSGANVTEALGVASATTAQAVSFDTTDAANQVSINTTDATKIDISVSGYYNIQFSAQLLNLTTTEDNVTFWYKHNGADISYSAGVATVPSKHGSFPGTSIVSWNLVYPFTAGDNFQLYFASGTGNTVCATYPAGIAPVHPVSPSVILTATFVSALYT